MDQCARSGSLFAKEPSAVNSHQEVNFVKNRMGFTARILGAGGLSLLLSTAVFAAPQDYRADGSSYRADRISTTGHISAVSREGDRYRITLDHGNYDYFVPATAVGSNRLAVGSSVRLGGLVAGDLVNVDVVAFPGEPSYLSDPYYVAVPYPSNGGWMSGTVQRVDRHLGYLTIQEDRSGAIVKIDVRHMDLRKPVNVWGIRAGDRISVNGAWETRGNFDARRIEY
jgi:hypothetical protein